MNEQQFEPLNNVIVYDAHGAPHRLASLWAEKPVVLALVRHLGCAFARQQIAELQQRAGEVEALGAELVVVAPCKPAHLRSFLRRHDTAGLYMVADPERHAYGCLRLRRSVAASLAWRDIAPLRAAWRQGFRSRGVQGDPWQQGGVFVIDPDGMRLFSHRCDTAGARWQWPDVVDALALLSAGTQSQAGDSAEQALAS